MRFCLPQRRGGRGGGFGGANQNLEGKEASSFVSRQALAELTEEEGKSIGDSATNCCERGEGVNSYRWISERRSFSCCSERGGGKRGGGGRLSPGRVTWRSEGKKSCSDLKKSIDLVCEKGKGKERGAQLFRPSQSERPERP